ncbi:hypothetical protein HYC85_012748 [Camellia sinensis]|uniref:type I protein arginine methyltransferase n=1 Tax=Camellia sinensis TaxID=4442 RepID=A0A7J7HDP6_CAMSI|nr:hypothetical protein HYC85_012748 [Camellia sinensis]
MHIAVSGLSLKNVAMEDAVEQKHKQLKFAIASVSPLSSSSSSVDSASPVVARFSFDSEAAELQFYRESESNEAIHIDLRAAQLFKLSPVVSVCISEGSETSEESLAEKKDSCSRSHLMGLKAWLGRRQGTIRKAQLRHWGTYYAAVIENRADFVGRVVVDVGAGSGILSLFAAQAGAKHVYAVEASEMAEYARKLIAGNPFLGQRITVIKGKVEDVELPEKADILISEPMGTLLVNERMLETYVIARDRFLVPNGKMFPTNGRIHMAPFSDEYLYVEIANKSLFWQQQNYYGVDLTPLYGSAFQGYFSQPVVDAFDPRVLVAPAISHVINFTSIKEEELYEIDVPLKFTASVGARIHGLACWFDVLFNGSTVQRWLSTAPGAPTTHWYQLRCVLLQPLYVMPGQEITGRLRMVAHNAQSYTIYLTLSAKMWGPGAEQGGILQTSSCKFDLKEPYYRMSQPQAYSMAQDQPTTHHLINTQDIQIQSQDEDGSEFMLHPSQNSDADLH